MGEEGFNITVGGTRDQIERYMDALVRHWSLAGLGLGPEDEDAKEKREKFFKPSPGCACAFNNETSVRVTSEITPMGVTNYSPKDWGMVTGLSSGEWHDLCLEGKADVLVDVRNHYESRIGYFVYPGTGEPALRPGIRRFSQWPLFVRRRMAGEEGSVLDPGLRSEVGDEGRMVGQRGGKNILTYCTGGIRCEKGARFLQESLSSPSSSLASDPSNPTFSAKDKVYTLTGGISAYLTWISAEIAAGRKTPADSLFKGRNYVFDGRGSVGLDVPLPLSSDGVDEFKERNEVEPVAQCHSCGRKEDRLSKCRSKGCHLILVVCKECESVEGGVRCCDSCRAFDVSSLEERVGKRPICECEKEREAKLWSEKGENGGARLKISKQKERKRDRKVKTAVGGMDIIDIQIKTID